MKLHNTLSRKVEDFKPQNTGQVSLYSCGPTVYDHIHIGNLSAFIYADTLRRTLKSQNWAVKHVMNYTDVDDKTIKRSAEKYKQLEPEAALKKLTDEYIAVFQKDMVSIGNNVDDMTFVRATDYIKAMQNLINDLHDQGFAYVADDGVYFSIAKYRASGKKYGQLLELSSQSTSNARINNDEYDKDSVHDFALWKTKKPGEPSWPFELDGKNLDGRPGWHIECSIMSSQNLGQPFDIHSGGVDLIFPHHENEIAQSTALAKEPTYAKFFFHNEHLLVDGKKMSKSLNNFFTLDEIVKKGFEPLAFRLMVLQSHYQSQLNFTWESLEAAQNRLQQLRAWADLKHQPSTDQMTDELDNLFKSTRADVLDAMQDNLNSPAALAAWNKLVNYMQTIPIPGVEGKYTDGTLAFLDDLFGLELSQRPDITDEQKNTIQKRQIARDARNFDEADRLRKQLEAEGIALRDTQWGEQWYRI